MSLRAKKHRMRRIDSISILAQLLLYFRISVRGIFRLTGFDITSDTTLAPNRD